MLRTEYKARAWKSGSGICSLSVQITKCDGLPLSSWSRIIQRLRQLLKHNSNEPCLRVIMAVNAYRVSMTEGLRQEWIRARCSDRSILCMEHPSDVSLRRCPVDRSQTLETVEIIASLSGGTAIPVSRPEGNNESLD